MYMTCHCFKLLKDVSRHLMMIYGLQYPICMKRFEDFSRYCIMSEGFKKCVSSIFDVLVNLEDDNLTVGSTCDAVRFK